MTSLSFPRGPYDIIIIKWELGFCLHAYGSLGGPVIVKDVWSYYDSLLINLKFGFSSLILKK
jgi:hypothetical protein